MILKIWKIELFIVILQYHIKNVQDMPEISSFYGIDIYMYMSEHNEWLDQHEEELMDNWERLGRCETPIGINPLQ